jgi:chitodextrinase
MLITTFSCIFPIKISVADPPDAPRNPNPADNSMNVSINTDLSWTCSDPDPGDELRYDVYFGKTSSPIKVENNISFTKYTPDPLAYYATYYWRIVAWDKTNASHEGPLWNFTTVMKLNNPPNIPNDPNPVDGSFTVSVDADLNWNCSDPDNDSLKYDVYFGDNNPPPNVASNISILTYNPGIMSYGITYYWKIVAWDIYDASRAGPVWQFQTNHLPYQPNTPSPANESTGVLINIDLSWTGDDPDAGDMVVYDVYFGTSSNPPHAAFNQSGLIYDPPGNLLYNTLYYWRIVAWDNHIASTVGPLWHFTTEINKPPNVPSNPDPSNNSTLVSIDTDLSWTCSDPDGDSIKYDVYFGTSSMPPKMINNQSDTFYNTGMMNYNTTYYWKIIAWDIYDTSNESPIWKFDTTSPSNNPPTIADPNPINGKTDVSVSLSILRVTIQDLDGDAFNWTITTSPNIGSSSGTSANNGTKNCSLIVKLAYSKTYTWYVKAYDGVYWTNKSYWFTTVSDGYQEPPQPPQNKKPNASAGGPYQGLINSIIRFDGSRSDDPDGNITSWLWDFGDNTIANGVSVYHSFLEAGTYTITLTVTDNQTATDTDTTTCVIRQSNRSPTKPTIAGPTSGTKNTDYTYNASSTDPDNDPLQYTFEWGGSISQSSGFLQNGMNYSVNHSWTTAGRYNLTVTVTDNQSEASSKITIYIDAIQTRGAGYLLDIDGDGIYDAFYSDETHQTVLVQRKGDSYLIDKNGDGTWEYVYNETYGLTSYQEPRKTPGFELVFTLGAIAVVILLSRKRKTL